MIIPDSNVWVALAIPQHPGHVVVEEWLHEHLGRQKLLFCRSSQQSFLRLLTRESIFKPLGRAPLSNDEAMETYRQIRRMASVGYAAEPPQVEPAWLKFAGSRFPSPNKWMDAYLAAFTLIGKFEFLTFDDGFRQYPGLKLTVLEYA